MQLNCHWLTSGPSEVYLFEWNYCEIMNEYFHICHLFVHNLFRFFWRNLTVSVQFEWKPWRYLLLTYFVQNLFRFFWRNITVSVQCPTTALVVHRFFLYEWNTERSWMDIFISVPYFVQNLFRYFLCNLTVSVQFEWKIMKVSVTLFVQNLFRFFWRSIIFSVQPLAVHRFFCMNEIWQYHEWIFSIFISVPY